MANRKKFTDHARQNFLMALRETANVSEAARRAGISRRRAYDVRDVDPVFAAAWKDAVETAIDTLEAEAWRRGKEGWDEPVFYRGESQRDAEGKPVTIRKYSDRMLELLLKAHRPEKYRERFDHTVGDDRPVTVGDADKLTDEQLMAIAMGHPVSVRDIGRGLRGSRRR